MPNGTSLGVGMMVKADDARGRPATGETAGERTDWLSEWKGVAGVATITKHTAECKVLMTGKTPKVTAISSLTSVLDAAPDYLKEVDALKRSLATNTVDKTAPVRLLSAWLDLARHTSTVASYILMFSDLVTDTVNVQPSVMCDTLDWVKRASRAYRRLDTISTVSIPANTRGLTREERTRYPQALRYNDAVCEFYSTMGQLGDRAASRGIANLGRDLSLVAAHRDWALSRQISVLDTINLLYKCTLSLRTLRTEISSRDNVGSTVGYMWDQPWINVRSPGDTSKEYRQEERVLSALLSLVFIDHHQYRKGFLLSPKEAFKRIKESRHPAAVRAMTAMRGGRG
ncbi:hypothetical protein KIPB_007888 [Kipferlia bialata]|uniref:Uncharacterized protein n=1 Tax=Kipferlia bialata TaxID=797122 RepID=A0A9K3CZW0_9EUKA|nr:hypothetical protein KIPB_007888 [Kipferlia bialata]|eukprot:g7888.t1